MTDRSLSKTSTKEKTKMIKGIHHISMKCNIEEIDRENIDVKTITEYLGDLKKLYLIENQLPFSSNIRSSMRVKQMEKHHFVDPSIATSILNMTVDMCINDLHTFGFFFEAMVERDLRIYAEANNWNIFHYQDYEGNEFDAVIEFDDGEYAAFEIKLSDGSIRDAIQSLSKFYAHVEKKPTYMCVIIGHLDTVMRDPETGIFIVPLTSLRP